MLVYGCRCSALIGSPGAGVAHDFELPDIGAGNGVGLPQESDALLTTELSL